MKARGGDGPGPGPSVGYARGAARVRRAGTRSAAPARTTPAERYRGRT